MKPTKREVQLTFAVHQDRGSFLATRATGSDARVAMEQEIRAHATVDLLVIDFTGTEAMTNSFTDEFLGKFYLSLAAGDVPAAAVSLVGLTEETRDAVSVCLERRKQVAVDADTHQLVGDSAVLASTYEQAQILGTFRAGALAEALAISVTNANNRLKRLVEAGALRRDRVAVPERGGKEFSYTVPDASAPAPQSEQPV